MIDLFYQIDKKFLILFTSLGGFHIDRLLRQFLVETNSCILRTNFCHDFQYNNLLFVLMSELLSLQMQLLFHSLFSKF